MEKSDRRKKRRRVDNGDAPSYEPITTQKGLMQKILWEHAKGELNGIIAVCDTPPITQHCRAIQNRATDLIMAMDAIIYNWSSSDKKDSG